MKSQDEANESRASSRWLIRAQFFRGALPIAYLLAVVWVNAYICRELFFREFTGYTNSMHGIWIAMARLAPASYWLKPGWWPFWQGGAPFDYVYAPLAPGLTALCAKLTGWPPGRAFYALSGFIYCLLPAAFFLVAWRLTRAPGYSFAAAIAYSLTCPTQLIVPDLAFRWGAIGDARRLYVTVEWDEIPHLTSLTFVLLVVLFLYLSFRDRRGVYYILTGIFMALAVLANPLGGVAILMSVLCMVVALGPGKRAPNTMLSLGIGVVAYIAICPLFPPSLIETIRYNAKFWESGWTWSSLLAFLATALTFGLLSHLLNRWIPEWPLRFFVLFAFLSTAITALWKYAGWHFLPQPGRYQFEMEIGLVLSALFAARMVLRRLDWKVTCAVAVLLLPLAGNRVISHRRFAKAIIKRESLSDTLEYRLGKWVEGRFSDQRVMMPGSIGQWLNAFTEVQQFGAGSFPNALNRVQQIGAYNVTLGIEAREAVAWMRAFGAQAVEVSGPNSEEFWKFYRNPQKFEGVLPAMWREHDTTVYAVPSRSSSLAHVVSPAALVVEPPVYGSQTGEIERYAAALEDPNLPPASFRWTSLNSAIIEAARQPDQVLSVQVNYHPGWRASANGKPFQPSRDGLGLMVLRPDCTGPCRIELQYDGGCEYRLCRLLSALCLLGVAGYAFYAGWRSWRVAAERPARVRPA